MFKAMTIGCRVKQPLLIASLMVLVAACGGTASKDDLAPAAELQSGNFFVGEQPVYAELINSKDGSWIFKTIAASDSPSAQGYLVRLNDLTAAFDTRIAECVPQVYPESHRCNPMNPFRDEDSGILDKLINGSIAVSTGGKIKDITYNYETTFNETAFNRAVDEALVNTDLNHRQLIALLNEYQAEVANAEAAMTAAQDQMQDHQQATARPALEVVPTVVGLTQYYQGDIDYTQLVDLEVADRTELALAELPTPAVLPCEARHCATKINAALTNLRANKRANLLSIDASMQPSTRTYNVHCNMQSYGGYLLQAECPAQVSVVAGEAARVPLNVTILSRDFDQLFPALDVSNEQLLVSIDGREVSFLNATDEYLTLSAQTIYYNATSHTTVLPVEIPPGIAVTYDLARFTSQAIDIESHYLQMTPNKAQRASFKFGFAVRYQLASDATEQTLHGVDTFNVDCAIRNRVTPGSCQAEAVADANKPNQDRRPRAPM